MYMRTLATPAYRGSIGQVFDRFFALVRAWRLKAARFPKKYAILSLVLSIIALGGAITFSMLPRTGASSAPVAVPGGEVASVQKDAPMLELHIANNGLVYLEGARINSVSRSIVVVSSDWDAAGLRWIIRTSDTTRFILPNGEFGTFTDIEKGDFINISGYLTASSPELSIEAETIRNTTKREAPVVHLEKIGEGD